MPAIVLSIHVGHPQSFAAGDNSKPWTSAICKTKVSGPVVLTQTNLEGDQQADQKHHGGPEKAVLMYSAKNYAAWNAEMPEFKFEAGAFGENLTVDGLEESICCIGDTFQIGDCHLQISQPRQPCWKLSRRWNLPKLAVQTQKTGRTGWYFRVLQTGVISESMTIELVERPFPELTIAWANLVMHGHLRNSDNELQLARCRLLAKSWQETLTRRAQGQVESESARKRQGE